MKYYLLKFQDYKPSYYDILRNLYNPETNPTLASQLLTQTQSHILCPLILHALKHGGINVNMGSMGPYQSILVSSVDLNIYAKELSDVRIVLSFLILNEYKLYVLELNHLYP